MFSEPYGLHSLTVVRAKAQIQDINAKVSGSSGRVLRTSSHDYAAKTARLAFTIPPMIMTFHSENLHT